MTRSRTLTEYAIIGLLAEKVVQHIIVTIAFYLDLGGIRSIVAVDWEILMIVGAFLAVLFFIALLSWIRNETWSLVLVGVLALADIIGEFVAQGRPDIIITVSFIVASILFLLVIREYRKNN